jgi:hypothetical protein
MALFVLENTMNLAEKIKNWPILAVHRFTEIEAILLSFEARLTALEPKKAEVKVESNPPFVPPIPIGPAPPFVPPVVTPTPPLFVPTPTAPPFEAIRLGPTPSTPTHDNPLDGSNLKS